MEKSDKKNIESMVSGFSKFNPLTKFKNFCNWFYESIKMYKTIKFNGFIEDKMHFEPIEELNIILTNMIPLINDGQYKRFNSFDFYNKSSKFKIIIKALTKVSMYYYLYPNERNRIISQLETIKIMHKSLGDIVEFILKLISKSYNFNDKQYFIEIRNFVAKEWIKRNIMENPNYENLKLKDLNYLNYNMEQYQEYLHNCLNFLIRDTKKFIARYPNEYKLNSDLDLEIIMSLKDSVYNDLKFATPDDVPNFQTVNFFSNEALLDFAGNYGSVKKPLILKGWFKEKPKSRNIDTLVYKRYKMDLKRSIHL